MGTLITGPRLGRWMAEEDATKPVIQPKPQSSPAFEAFGALLLFTCSIANTGVVSPQLACGGLIAGVAAISSGCAVMAPWGAFVTGFCAAWAYYVGGTLLIKLRLDDVSHAISMHGFAGAFGLIATGLFASDEAYEDAYGREGYERISACYGIFYNGGIAQLAAQALGLAFILGWVGFTSTFFYAIFHVLAGTRYPSQWEENGIDFHKFGGATQYAHVAVVNDTNRFAVGLLNFTNYGNEKVEEPGAKKDD